ncbi:hypothetical protein [Tabrizicola soli]|uniref:Uncharacterized protein n=1 Tax=Tabrizicola soli TaxID=2185115 RepID=A0ABV7DZA8_9RHOB|nr:hypothetical protein [Tabrizicola soli]
MLNRRRFMAASAAMALSSLLPSTSFAMLPLKARLRPRRIFARKEASGSWLLFSDAPFEPRKVVRHDVIERSFGAGAYNTLSQRDHWEMIEAGWFSGDDLHLPVPLGDDTYLVWRSYYHPVTEAHDLLTDIFADKYGMMRWGTLLPNGIALGEHPCTPRYATARAATDRDLIRTKFDLEALGGLVQLVLPDELMPQLAEYDDPEMMEDLMWRTHHRSIPSNPSFYQRAAEAARQKAMASTQAS